MNEKISIHFICFALINVFTAWILDVVSTWIGITFFGMIESSNVFLVYPWLWLVVVELWILAVAFSNWAPLSIRKIIIIFLTMASFIPSISNMIVILRILI